MKNFKSTILTTTAALAAGLLAALCSGCDGAGGEGDVAGDAGAGDAGRSDVVRADVVKTDIGKTSDAGKTPCQVPTPKFTLGGVVTTTPRKGYWVVQVESVPCLANLYEGMAQPTDCNAPADGFASGVDQLWYRVSVQKWGSGYVLGPGNLIPVATGSQIAGGMASFFGNWAVCSPSGKFLGWGG